jgi:glycosyltransferase involved in cell wall biosynthesis
LKVSIAMATYNGARHLREQLDSFVAQTKQPDQLVITDDRSSDETVQIARDFARTAPFEVRVEVNDCRLGVAANFNRALSLCDGDLVLLSDQDDVWFASKIETLANRSAAEPAKACWIGDALLTDAVLNSTGTTKMEKIRGAGLPDRAMVMGCCTAFRSDLLGLLLPIPPNQPAHDNWLVEFADLLSLARRMEIPMQHYRRHGGNVSQVHVNRIDRPGIVEQLWRPFGLLVARARSPGSLLREYSFLSEVVRRLNERSALLSSLVGPRAEQILIETTARRDRLACRLRLRTLPFKQRPRYVLHLWRTGIYHRSPGGLAGAAKDLLFT